MRGLEGLNVVFLLIKWGVFVGDRRWLPVLLAGTIGL